MTTKDNSINQQTNDNSEKTFFMRKIISINEPAVCFAFEPIGISDQEAKIDANSTNNSIISASGDLILHRFHPVFNLDNQFFTPAFVLDCDISKCVSNSDYLKQSFLNKTQQFLQKSEPNVALPSSKNKFCCVCKVNYQDYLTHLDDLLHKKYIKSSKFDKDINRLCKTFKKPSIRGRPKKQNKTKIIAKNNKIIDIMAKTVSLESYGSQTERTQ